MDRDALRPVLIGIVCVLAITLAASTLTSPVDTGGGGGGINPMPTDNPSQGGGLGDESQQPNTTGGVPIPPCIQLFSGPGPYLALAAILAAIAVFFYTRYGGLTAFGMTFAAGLPLLILVLLLTAGCGIDFQGGNATPMNITSGSGPGEGNGSSGPLGSGGGSMTDPTLPTALVMLVLGVAAVAVVGLYLYSDTGDDEEDPDDEAETPAEQRQAIGRAAGRAADRIEDDVDVENEVYRAWREMTEHLDVDRPESSTPSEFADAAVDAGMSEGEVGELTRLFEEVRYGGATPTEDRERRAVAALRRIEDEYADADDADGGAP
ncbi:DUF4129 domain-containing protein [Halostella salina]|uniref:DUF4129 domain-containing protein n=1 Tax=Halostella salina TaxID=1547897 RepID=UPI000EF83095|nr:DUF4129 domain-containing protein [Halostella salina]